MVCQIYLWMTLIHENYLLKNILLSLCTDSQGPFPLILTGILLWPWYNMHLFSCYFIFPPHVLFVIKVTILKQSILTTLMLLTHKIKTPKLFQDKWYNLIRRNENYLSFSKFHFLSIQLSLNLVNCMLYLSDLDYKALLCEVY